MSKSKLDITFPTSLSKINGYKIFINVQNRFGRGLFLYVNERIPYKLLQRHPTFSKLEIVVLEVYQNNRKWLFLRL